MPHLLHMHWLWLFGALSLGIAAGWLAYPVAAPRWNARPVHLAIGAAAIGILLAVAKLVPARYGIRLENGVIVAVVGATGGFVGWALRDLAEFTPRAASPMATASAVAAGGSYLFRDALAGMGADTPYMRAPTRHGGPARVHVPSAASLAQAPAPGGYTFPTTLPFADATTSRPPETATGLRRHWSWPAQSDRRRAP